MVHSKRADLPGYKEMTVNHVTSEAGVSDIDLEDVGTANVAETLTKTALYLLCATHSLAIQAWLSAAQPASHDL